MMDPSEVVVASSDLENRTRVAGMFALQGVDPICASTVNQCREIFGEQTVGLVLCDLELADGNYSDILAAAACFAKKMPKVVVMSRLIKFRDYNRAKRRGVFDIIATPCRSVDIEWMAFLAKRA
jgi:DNA-binding NtrC family response regulator